MKKIISTITILFAVSIYGQSDIVNIKGEQRITGEKIFLISPIVPNAVELGEAINKGQLDEKASLDSPTFTGDPKSPTPTIGDNDTSNATTAFVNASIAANIPSWQQTLTTGSSLTSSFTSDISDTHSFQFSTESDRGFFRVARTASNTLPQAALGLDDGTGAFKQGFAVYQDQNSILGLTEFNTSPIVPDGDANDEAVNYKQLINRTGWAQYSDNVYTVGSPLTINQGVSTKLTNNAATSITTQLPEGVTGFWSNSTNKITPENDGDFYQVNVRFTGESSVADGVFDVYVDIGAPMNEIVRETRTFRKGAGNPQDFNFTFQLFSASTFVANGGEIYVESISGDTDVYDIQIIINRVHEAK